VAVGGNFARSRKPPLQGFTLLFDPLLSLLKLPEFGQRMPVSNPLDGHPESRDRQQSNTNAPRATVRAMRGRIHGTLPPVATILRIDEHRILQQCLPGCIRHES
jgi:hypothetical protein